MHRDAIMANPETRANRPVPDPHRIDNILKEDVITSMAIGLLPFPLFDAALLMGLQVTMVQELCREYQVPFSQQKAVTALSAVVGAMPVISVLGVGSLIKTIPILGTVGAGATLALVSGAVTYAQGRAVAEHLAEGGTLANLGPARMKRLASRELDRGLAFARALLPIAERQGVRRQSSL